MARRRIPKRLWSLHHPPPPHLLPLSLRSLKVCWGYWSGLERGASGSPAGPLSVGDLGTGGKPGHVWGWLDTWAMPLPLPPLQNLSFLHRWGLGEGWTWWVRFVPGNHQRKGALVPWSFSISSFCFGTRSSPRVSKRTPKGQYTSRQPHTFYCDSGCKGTLKAAIWEEIVAGVFPMAADCMSCFF